MTKMIKLSKFITITMIIIASIGNISVKQSVSSDGLYLVFISYFSIYIFMRLKIRIPKSKGFYISLSFLLIWLYGIIIGFYNGNNNSYIFRNFAGMTIYLFYIFLYNSNLNTKTIEKLLISLSLFASILTIIGYFLIFSLDADITSIPVLNTFQLGEGVLYSSANYIYISYMFGLYSFLIGKKINFKRILLLVIPLFSIIYFNQMDSFKLGIIVFTALILILNFQKYIKIGNFIATIIILFTLIFFFSPALYYIFFSVDDAGNLERWEQITHVIQNFKFFGHGIGATFNDGIGSIYAIEVILFDIFYKFGIIAIFIIYSYLDIVFDSIKLILKSNSNPFHVIPLASMGYLFLGLSNPVIFSPGNVVLHCISMLLISRYKNELTSKSKINNFELIIK